MGTSRSSTDKIAEGKDLMVKTIIKTKPAKLTEAERHKRFVEVARKLDIPDEADLSSDFFNRLVKQRGSITHRQTNPATSTAKARTDK
jgi:hypothetical protein